MSRGGEIIAVRVLVPGRPACDGHGGLAGESRGDAAVRQAPPALGRFPELHEMHHPHLAPYVDLYDIKGRAFVLSYHTRSTLAALLRGGAPAVLPEWGDVLHQEEPPAMPGESHNRISHAAAGLVCLHVGRAAEYLHEQGLVHGGITTDCILLTRTAGGERRVMLSDYGAYFLMGGMAGCDLAHGLEFCAPEVIASCLVCLASGTGQPDAHTQGEHVAGIETSADLWSIGAVLLYALSKSGRRLPWSSPTGSVAVAGEPSPPGAPGAGPTSASAAICSGILAFAGFALPSGQWCEALPSCRIAEQTRRELSS